VNSLVEKITKLYHEEAALDRKALVYDDLPSSYEAITPEWLTAILCREHPGAKVANFALDRADDGFSNRRRIFLEYNEAGNRADLSRSVFCKACHDLTSRLMFGVTGAGPNEVLFFNVVRAMVNLEAPRGIFARCDPNSMNTMIIMHDMIDAKFFEEDTVIDRDRASQMIQTLAALHGSFCDPQKMAKLDGRIQNFADFWEQIEVMGLQDRSNNGFRNAQAVIPPRLFAQAERIWPATKASVGRHRGQPLTLTHGDCHLKNWYLNGQSLIGLNDWQSLSTGHWSRDVAYALSTSLKIDDRRAWERDLLLEYVDALRAAGGPRVTFDEAWKDYCAQMFSGLAFWTFTLSPSPGETAVHSDRTKLKFVKRMTTAIDDLDSIQMVS
jgi:hypothetical protein